MIPCPSPLPAAAVTNPQCRVLASCALLACSTDLSEQSFAGFRCWCPVKTRSNTCNLLHTCLTDTSWVGRTLWELCRLHGDLVTSRGCCSSRDCIWSVCIDCDVVTKLTLCTGRLALFSTLVCQRCAMSQCCTSTVGQTRRHGCFKLCSRAAMAAACSFIARAMACYCALQLTARSI